MGIFSHSNNDGELKAVFDLGSSSVGCALFFANKTDSPKIIYSIRESVPMEEKTDGERFLNLTLKSLDVLAEKVAKAGVGAPKKIHIILSSPWYASQTRVIKLAEEKPFIFTPKVADALMAKELAVFKEQYQKENTNNSVRQIEAVGMKTLINGYPTGKPAGQKGTDLEMNIFLSMGSEQVLQKIEEIAFRHFHAKKVHFSSFILSSFVIARDLFVHHEDFILIDIGGEVTDISLVKKEVLKQSASFPMGRNFMIRGLASGMGTTLDEAKSLLSLYKDGHAEAGVQAKIEPAITKLRLEWMKSFQESLANLSNDVSIPAVVFVTVDPDLAEFFADIIKNEQFNQYILTESKFQVIFLGLQALHGIVNFEDKTIRDPFLIIESVYINRFL